MSKSAIDDLELSSSTLAALKEFLKEKEDRENKLRIVHTQTPAADVDFDENWQLSQFWYDDETIETLVRAAIRLTEDNARIALLSCPTLYSKMKKVSGARQVILFEYDRRFAALGPDFIPYDYKSPLDVPKDFSGSFDLIIADPPFLSEECLTKTAVTIKLLSGEKIIVCTGSTMADLVERLLGVKKSNFLPRHKNNLANEFWCYSNCDIDGVLI